MQRTKKKAVAILATIALFSSIALAEGDMGGGGLAYEVPPVKVSDRTLDGDMGGGGRSLDTTKDEYGLDWLLSSIGKLLGL